MYQKFFGFSRRPFDLVPDPDFLFLGESHDSALANLLLGIESGKGFIVIVGAVGTGKTTILRAVLRRLGRELDVAVLNQPDLEPAELLRTVLAEFGVDVKSEDKVELRRTLREFLERRARPAILAIDEAHLLSEESLEQVRLLSNFEESDHKLLQIVLAGQPELKELLSRIRLRPLAQRIEMFYEILPLSAEETRAYILRRVQIAGQPEGLVFEPRALDDIYERAGGVPRLINVLAERALITAYVVGTKTVSPAIVREAFNDLGEVTQRVMGRLEDSESASTSPRPLQPIPFRREASSMPEFPKRRGAERTRGGTWQMKEGGSPRKLERWFAGIGLAVLVLVALISFGTQRASSSKPAHDVAIGAPSESSPTVAIPSVRSTPAEPAPATSPDTSRVPPPIRSSSEDSPAPPKPAPEPVKPAPAIEKPAARAEPPTSVTLVREREAPPLRPEDVPLVDEASGLEGNARFAIQCGSFRDLDRARELAARIGDSTGEVARVVPMQMSSGTWHRVLLGDFDSEEQARAKISDVHGANRLLILQVVRLSRPVNPATDSEE